MPNFGGDLIQLVLAAGLAALAVYWLRKRILPFAAIRGVRVFAGLALLIVQTVVAILLASVDLGSARAMGILKPEDQPVFPWLVGLVAVGVAIETFILLHGDFAERERVREEKAQEEARGLFEHVRAERDFQDLVSRLFLNVVELKRKRLANASNMAELISQLKPAEQSARMVNACWELVNHLFQQRGGQGKQLRVAYFRYRKDEDRLSLAHCYNGTSDSCVAVRTDEITARMKLNHPTGCLAVAAAKTGLSYFIPDTEEEASKPTSPFVFFEKSQAMRVKSIAALPIKVDGDSGPHSVLMIDTDFAGFFTRDLEVPLEQVIIRNLAYRLRLEEHVAQLQGAVPNA